MLVTSQFVVLNLPKTGSSFVRSVIKAIYARRRWRWGADRFLKEFMLPKRGGVVRGRDQHGSFAQVPAPYRHLPVVSVIRSPYAKLLSAYEYRWWVDNAPLPREELLREFPHFPQLSLDDFVRLWDLATLRKLGGSNPLGLGHQTVQFVDTFFREPARVLPVMSDDYVASGAFRADMADVTFLRQERLNEDLAAFLERFGFTPEEVELCRRHRRVNETVGGVADRRTLWTRTATDYVRVNERYMLEMLRQLGLQYDEPPVSR